MQESRKGVHIPAAPACMDMRVPNGIRMGDAMGVWRNAMEK